MFEEVTVSVAFKLHLTAHPCYVCIQIVPEKMIIGLSASISFEIVN